MLEHAARLRTIETSKETLKKRLFAPTDNTPIAWSMGHKPAGLAIKMGDRHK
jgi:hypothetical protein